MNISLRVLTGALGWLGIGATLTMCGPSSTSYCDARCDCVGCSARDYDNCIYDYEDDEIVADRRGCLDFFYDYADCVEYGDACRGREFDHYCRAERDRWRNCVD